MQKKRPVCLDAFVPDHLGSFPVDLEHSLVSQVKPRFVQVDTVATTLTLAEQNHAEELKRVCLEFASRNLSTVMCSEGYHHMISSCPQLQVTPFPDLQHQTDCIAYIHSFNCTHVCPAPWVTTYSPECVSMAYMTVMSRCPASSRRVRDAMYLNANQSVRSVHMILLCSHQNNREAFSIALEPCLSCNETKCSNKR